MVVISAIDVVLVLVVVVVVFLVTGWGKVVQYAVLKREVTWLPTLHDVGVLEQRARLEGRQAEVSGEDVEFVCGYGQLYDSIGGIRTVAAAGNGTQNPSHDDDMMMIIS